MQKTKKRNNRRKNKIFSWSLFLLTFVPNFCVAFANADKHPIAIENEELLRVILNLDIWEPAFGIGIIITLAWSLIECKLHGLWIGPLRVIINILISLVINGHFDGFTLLSGGFSLYIVFMAWAIITGKLGEGSGKIKIGRVGFCIICGQEKIPIYQISGDKWEGADGEIYTLRGGMAYDQYNRSYVVGYLD